MTQTLRDQELQRHYDDLFDTFGTHGWELFEEQVKGYTKRCENVREMRDVSVDFRRGQLDVLDWFAQYKQMHEHAFQMLLAQEAGEIEDDEPLES